MRRLTSLAADAICGSAPQPTHRLAAARQRNRCRSGCIGSARPFARRRRLAHWRRNLDSNPLVPRKQEKLFRRAFFDRFGLQTASLRPERDRGSESRSLHQRVSCELNPSDGAPQAVVAGRAPRWSPRADGGTLRRSLIARVRQRLPQGVFSMRLPDRPRAAQAVDQPTRSSP